MTDAMEPAGQHVDREDEAALLEVFQLDAGHALEQENGSQPPV
jgi:hypothetical protein